MQGFLRELRDFMRTHKKLWLLPLLLAAATFAAVIFLLGGTIVPPFIYSLF